VRAADRAVDVVVDASSLRGVSEQNTLPDFTLDAGLPGLLDGEHPVDAIEHPLDGRAVLEVPACDLGPQIDELFRLGLLGISGERTYPDPAPEEAPRHRSPLLARGPADQDQTPPITPVFHNYSYTLIVLRPTTLQKRT
jgi:hypothetical protein